MILVIASNSFYIFTISFLGGEVRCSKGLKIQCQDSRGSLPTATRIPHRAARWVTHSTIILTQIPWTDFAEQLIRKFEEKTENFKCCPIP